MSEQVFISYRREGGDAQAKLICSELTRRGFSVFFDYDSIQGGYFDNRIFSAIEGCNDFILVLPYGSLERCYNEGDWVRLEIRHALAHRKNIIPILMDGYSFPSYLPPDIDEVRRYNGLEFSMRYFDAMMDSIIDHMVSAHNNSYQPQSSYSAAPYSPGPVRPIEDNRLRESLGLEFKVGLFGGEATVVGIGSCRDNEIVVPKFYNGKPVTTIGKQAFKNGQGGKIILQAGITKICEEAFQNSRYDSIVIPETVTEIENWAFADCYFKEINYNGSRNDWDRIKKAPNLYGGKFWDRPVFNFLK